MSAGHPAHSHVEPTAFDPDRFASEPGETGPHPGDAAATAPRHYRGCTAHQKQLLGFGFPLCAAHTTIVSKPRTTASIVTDSPILTPRGSGNATAAGDARLLAGPGLSEWSAAVDPDLPGSLWLLVVARLRGQV